MKLYIRAYPKFTNIVSAAGNLSDIKALSRRLTDSRSIASSSLYSSESGYYLCFETEVKRLSGQLGAICEHSERVFIGKDYYFIIREHLKPIISGNAVLKLSQK